MEGGTAAHTATNGVHEADADAKQLKELRGQDPNSTDFANYFCTYAFLYHQVWSPSYSQTVFAVGHPFKCIGNAAVSPVSEYLVLTLSYLLQKDMLEDHKRTGAYYQAVMQNRRQFEGKVRTVCSLAHHCSMTSLWASV